MQTEIMSYRDFCASLLKINPMKVLVRPREVDMAYESIENAKDKLFGDAKEKAKSKVYKRFEVYFNKKWDAECFNKTHFESLEELLGVPKLNQDMVKQRMKVFHMAIINNPKPYPALMRDYGKHTFLFTNESAQKVKWDE